MAGFQFAHVDSFAMKAAKRKTGGHSVRSIVAEAQREPGACDHVNDPLPPTLLYGAPVSELEGICSEYVATMKDAQGRKVRADGLCLMAGVVSCPPGAEAGAWESIRGDSIGWLKERYGERLRSVIEHKDEEHPHIHWYVIPLPGERFDAVHEGKRAAAEVKASGFAKGDQNTAYKAAMRSWQDSYFDTVGLKNGLTRIGPGRRRLSRYEWKQEQHAVELVAAKMTKVVDLEAVVGTKLESAEATIEVMRAEALSEAQAIREKATNAADKAIRDACSQGRDEAIRDFGKTSLWAKLTGLLSSKDKEIEALKTEAKTLRKDLKEARKETTKTIRLLASVKAAGKSIAHKLLGLEKERDRTLERAEKAECQRDKFKAQVFVLKERDGAHAGLDKQLSDIAWERDSERARADQILRQLSKLEASNKAQDVPTAPSARFTNIELGQRV